MSQQKMFQVDTIEFSILESEPQQLLVTVTGQAASSGWTNPALVLVDASAADGIYAFDFCGTPPTGVVTQVLSPIKASFRFKQLPQDLKGVIVHSASLSLKRRLNIGDYRPTPPLEPYLETLLGVTVQNETLTLQVPSNGCTKKGDFKLKIIKGFTIIPPFVLQVYRTKPDLCKGYFPNGTTLTYSFEELDLLPTDTFTVENTIGLIPVVQAINS